MDKIISEGQSMFDDLRENNCYYVDKTEFLYELRGGKIRNHVSLFTRPRRFGKTLMMSMIENFFNIEKDSRKLFEGLNIMNHPEFCEEHMNKYPVIFLTLKDVEGRNYKAAYDVFARIISKACQEMSAVIDNDKISPVARNIFRRLESKTATEEELKDSLVTLMDILHTVYDKKVILLIDEYDVPGTS